MKVLDLTPPATPALSPLDRENSDPLTAIIMPSAFTVVVPFESVIDWEMFGYGIGTGPPGDGVLQTSGIVAIEMPLLPLWTRELEAPLTLTVTGIGQARAENGISSSAAPRSPLSELAQTSE